MSKPEDSHNNTNVDSSESALPRSLYVPRNDSRADIREIVNIIFTDKLMMVLSLVLLPIILLPFIVQFDTTVIEFFNICDGIILTLFITEYLTKLYCAENRWNHIKAPWHMVDLVIIMLPFMQYLPFIELAITGSPSLLLRLLRVPRAVAVGSRAVVSRRTNHYYTAEKLEVDQETVIRQVDIDLKTVHNTLTWKELEAHVLDKNRQEWIDLHNVSEEGFKRLSSILNISLPHFKSSLVDEIYPHIDYLQKASFIFLQSGKIQYPEHSGNYLTISRSGIIVICNGTKLFTVSRHNINLFTNVLDSTSQTRHNQTFMVTVLYGIFEHMLENYKQVLSEVEIELIKIGSTPRARLPKDFLERIYMLDKEVSRLVSNLVHFKDLMGSIIAKKVPLEGFDIEAKEAFQVLQDNAVYLNEIAHDSIDNLRSIIDLYINQTSFEANRILKILAVITAISVIPSAVGGLMGMNLLDVPFGAYLWQMCFIIGVAMTFALYTFYKLGWLKT
ncbi:MAG: magnesium transporter CorA family protein [Candidatus Bathyarchaeia archaeon]|jgi:Mg2+ and Co2+ transporter CorA